MVAALLSGSDRIPNESNILITVEIRSLLVQVAQLQQPEMSLQEE
ncbi:MAG: hypothetical protein AAFR26_09545 [Cyanobacteria bacterium J06626_4]